MKGTDRIEWIDIAKGFGILLVILGHTIAYDCSHIVYNSIYAFHMPLFFFLMGFVYNEKKYSNFGNVLNKKIRQLLKPWAVIYVISLMVCICVPSWRENLSFHQMLVELYTANSNNIQNSSIWFLMCSFFVFVIVHFYNKIPKSKLLIVFSIIFAFGLLYMQPGLLFISKHIHSLPCNRLPFKIDTAFIAAVFFIIAQNIRMHANILFSYNCILVFMGGIIFMLLASFNGETNVNTLSFGKYRILYYFIALLGIICTIRLSKIISECKNTRLKKILLFYGKNSLIIFGFQSLFIRLYILICNHYCNEKLILYGNNPIYHQLGSFFVVAFVCSPIIVYLFSLIKRNFLYHE